MNIRRLKADFKEVFSNGLKSGILVEMMPRDVAEYLGQKISDSDQYEEVKEMILRYVEMKADYDGNAMDVDNFEIYDQSDDAGAWGHRAADCLDAMLPLWAERPQAQRVSSE